jgi:hypothetical protein
MDNQKSNIILTKVFKKSELLKQVFKYAYISLHKLCNCPKVYLDQSQAFEPSEW